MSDCRQTEREGEKQRDLRVVGEMSTLMFVCRLQLSAGASVWDADDATQFFIINFWLPKALMQIL